MTRFLPALALLAALQSGLASASFRVVAPVRANNSAIAHELALFGRPAYGGSIVAALVLSPPSKADGCVPYNITELTLSLDDAGIQTPMDAEQAEEAFILLVQRGGCHFVDKVRNAQRARASAVVIYNTGDNDEDLPVLADDGAGGDIRIPSLIIHHGDAQDLIGLVKTDLKTIVSLTWDVPHPDDRVEFSLWFSSRMAPLLQTFVDRFRPVVLALGESVKFTPYYDVHLGSTWGCAKGNAAKPTHCPQLCVYDEKYCAFDPEQNNTVGLDGKDVIEEAVRQLCVYEHAEATNNSVLFWDYLAAFNTQCSVADATAEQFNRECSEGVQKTLKIPSLAECEAKGDDLLASQIEALRKYHVMHFPEFTVNDVPLYGSITCDSPVSLAMCSPLRMICAGFLEATAPVACQPSYWGSHAKKTTTTCEAPLEMDDCGQCSQRNTAEWNAQCAGCDGVPHSGKKVDDCGVCDGDGTFDVCGRCLPVDDPRRDKSCLDCKGVPNGFAERDTCGVCGGHGSFDACGLCLDANDPRRQNFACRVIEDPDAVKAKLEIEGIRMKQFHGELLMSFRRAVAFATDTKPSQVLVKSVDETEKDTAMVLFFMACDTDECRTHVSKKLADPSASQAISMKMKSVLDEVAYGLELSKSIERVSLHSMAGLDVDSTTPIFVSNASSMWWPGLVVACGMTLVVALVLVRVRDDRLRRDFRELFARYTPLTSMEDEEEHEYGVGRRPAGTGANAW